MSDLAPKPEDFPFGYRALTLNEHRSTVGAEVVAQREATFLVDRFDFMPIQLRDQRIGLHLLSGGDFGTATKVFRFLSLLGVVKDTTPAKLEDRISRLIQTFDVEEAQYADPTSQGGSRLDFYCPTDAPPSGFSSPVHEMFLARPSAPARVFDRRGGGLAASYAIELVCAEVPRYLYDATTVTANSGNSWSVAAPNWDANMGEMSHPVLVLTFGAGAHDTNCTLRFVPTTVGSQADLVLDMSGDAGASTINVDMRHGRIWKGGTIDPLTRVVTGGTRRDDLRTSSVDSFWGIGRNGGTFSVPLGRTGLTSVSLTYRQARG